MAVHDVYRPNVDYTLAEQVTSPIDGKVAFIPTVNAQLTAPANGLEVQGVDATGEAPTGNPVYVGGLDSGGLVSPLPIGGAGGVVVQGTDSGLYVQPVLQPSNLLTPLRINTAASGVTQLVAAASGQTTRVHRMKLSVAGAVIVQIRNGATVLEVFNFAGAGGNVILDFDGNPWYETSANTALNINLSAAVQVDGRVEYITSA